jgi:hypothetical protein
MVQLVVQQTKKCTTPLLWLILKEIITKLDSKILAILKSTISMSMVTRSIHVSHNFDDKLPELSYFLVLHRSQHKFSKSEF